jgi:aryl-alcohol dehydrogenase-like predicted oxidoreductase
VRYVDPDLADGRRISKIGLGTWQFGTREWGYGRGYAEGEAGKIVRRALELGITLIDTAEIYGLGRSEKIVGAALRGLRAEVFVATKLFPLLPFAPVVRSRAASSARRLGLERIDLYQVHRPNPFVGDGTTMRGMRALQDIGRIAEVGVSNYPLARWRRAEAILGRRVLSNQVAYNLVDRDAERALIPYAAGSGRLVIAHTPLARGFLSARYTPDHRPRNSVRRWNRLFRPQTLEQAQPLFATLRELARAHDATPAQVALAWIVRHQNVVAIVGAARAEQVDENAHAADLELSDDEAYELSRAAEAFNARAERA